MWAKDAEVQSACHLYSLTPNTGLGVLQEGAFALCPQTSKGPGVLPVGWVEREMKDSGKNGVSTSGN